MLTIISSVRNLRFDCYRLLKGLKHNFTNFALFLQCDGMNGACPDSRVGGRNDAIMLNGQRTNGVTTVVFQRSLDAQERFDQVIPPVGRVNVIAAIGPLNSRKEANYHGSERTGTQGTTLFTILKKI